MLKILTIVGSDEYLSLPVKPNRCLRIGNIMLALNIFHGYANLLGSISKLEILQNAYPNTNLKTRIGVDIYR